MNFWNWIKSLFKTPPIHNGFPGANAIVKIGAPPSPAPAPAPAPIVIPPPVVLSEQRVLGLDVSHYQDPLNWPAALALGYKFALCKATDGWNGVDAKFVTHSTQAKNAGLLIGGYHFFRFANDPKIQAQHLMKILESVGLAGQIIPTLDVEWDKFSPKYGENKFMDAPAILEALTCLEEIERLCKRSPMIYTDFYFWPEVWPTKWGDRIVKPEDFSRFIPWIPSYADSLKPSGDAVKIPLPWKQWTFWQDSDHFTLGNVKDIDTNVFRGSLDDLKKLVM